MKQSDTLAALGAALVKAQSAIKPVTKDRQNPHFKNNYATLDAIMEAARPILTANGLSIVQGGGAPVSNSEGNVVGVSVETMLLHVSGEFITSGIVLPLDKPSAQAVGSAVTYGRRYGVAAILSLTTEEDDDGNVATANTLPDGVRSVPRPAPRQVEQTPTRVQEAQAAVAASAGDDPACPKCEGRMWDNRLSKKNPKAPDFKCRDRACDGVIWPPKATVNTPAAVQEAVDRLASVGGPYDDAPPPDDDDMPPF